jgi:IS5 family transposase
MLRILELQQRFCLSDPAMKEALHDTPLFREFATIDQGVDAQSGLVHTVAGTPANVNDLNMAGALVHADEEVTFGDAGHQGVHKRPEGAGPTWHAAMRPGLRRQLNPFIEPDFVAERVEKMKASIRAQVEHPFRVLKRQFGFTRARYRGLKKNTAQIITLFALGNLWMARRQLMGAQR